MRGKKEETSSAKQETFSASGVCVGAYVLEVGADCRSFSRFAPRPEKENARALADAFEESERDDLSAPVAALEELDERAADVTDKIEHAHALLKDVLSGRFDRAFVMREIDGLLGLSERLDRDGRYEEQVRLARALHGLLATMFRWLDLIRMLRRALRSAKASNDQAGQAWALHELGTLHLSAGDTETAERLLRDALRGERRLDAVGSCTTRHNLDFCARGRFVRRAAAVKVVAALVVFTVVITAAGVLAGAALSGDEHAATPSLGPDASFGALLVGETSAPQTVSLEAGAAALRIGRITVDDPREFLVDSSCPTELEPGQPCPIEVRFRPTAPGERASELRVALEGVGLLRAKLTGVGMNVVAARLDPDSLDLGEADVGTRTAAKTAILHAGSKPLRVTSVTSGSRAFGVESECSGTLAAGESCKIEVTFAPAAPGADATTLTVTKGDGGALRTALQGTGVANQPETHDPPVLDDFLDLGEVGIGDSSSEQALTLTAGSRPLTVATTESNSPEFQVAATCLGTLDANERCEI